MGEYARIVAHRQHIGGITLKVLTVDVGNTNICIGVVDDDTVLFVERLETNRAQTKLEFVIQVNALFDLYRLSLADIDGSIISSVVPSLSNELCMAITQLVGTKPLVVGPGLRTGLNILMDNPASVGADLVVDAVAGVAIYKAPLAIIDMGTATTISVIDRNRNYIGGMIIPGARISLDALTMRAAKLPQISLEPPGKLIGTETTDCMKSGIIYGQAACLDGMIDRIEEELGYTLTVVATGGISGHIVPYCKREIIYDEELTLKGLAMIYRKNI